MACWVVSDRDVRGTVRRALAVADQPNKPSPVPDEPTGIVSQLASLTALRTQPDPLGGD